MARKGHVGHAAHHCALLNECGLQETAPVEDGIGAGDEEGGDREQQRKGDAEQGVELRAPVRGNIRLAALAPFAVQNAHGGDNGRCQNRQCAELGGNRQPCTYTGEEEATPRSILHHDHRTPNCQHRKCGAGGVHGEEVRKLHRLRGEGVECRGKQTGPAPKEATAQEEDKQDCQGVEQRHDKATCHSHAVTRDVGARHHGNRVGAQAGALGQRRQRVQALCCGCAQVKRKVAVGEGAGALLGYAPQGIQRALVRILELFPRIGQAQRRGIETGRRALVGVRTRAIIKAHVPRAQGKARREQCDEQEIDQPVGQARCSGGGVQGQQGSESGGGV